MRFESFDKEGAVPVDNEDLSDVTEALDRITAAANTEGREAMGAPAATSPTREAMLRERTGFDMREKTEAAQASRTTVDAARVQASIDALTAGSAAPAYEEAPRMISPADIEALRAKMYAAHGAEADGSVVGQSTEQTAAQQAEYASLVELSADVTAQVARLTEIRTQLGLTFKQARTKAVLEGFGVAENVLRHTQKRIAELQEKHTGLGQMPPEDFTNLLNLRARAAKHVARVERAQLRIQEQRMDAVRLEERADDLQSQQPEIDDVDTAEMLEELGAGYAEAEAERGPDVFYEQMEATEAAGAVYATLAERTARSAQTVEGLGASRKGILSRLRSRFFGGGNEGGGNGDGNGGGNERGGRRRGWKRVALVSVLLLGAIGGSYLALGPNTTPQAAAESIEQQVEINHTVKDGDWLTSVTIERFPEYFTNVPVDQQDDVTKQMMERIIIEKGAGAEAFFKSIGVGSGDPDKIYPGEVLKIHKMKEYALQAVNEWRTAKGLTVVAATEAATAPVQATRGLRFVSTAAAAEPTVADLAATAGAEFNKTGERTYIADIEHGGGSQLMLKHHGEIFEDAVQAGVGPARLAGMFKRIESKFGSTEAAQQFYAKEVGFRNGDPGNVVLGDELNLDAMVSFAEEEMTAWRSAQGATAVAPKTAPEPVERAAPAAAVDEAQESEDAPTPSAETAEAASEARKKMSIESGSLTADLWRTYSSEYPTELAPHKAAVLGEAIKILQADKGAELEPFLKSIGVVSGKLDLVQPGQSINAAALKPYLDRAVQTIGVRAGVIQE